jgi:hypothetical protein
VSGLLQPPMPSLVLVGPVSLESAMIHEDGLAFRVATVDGAEAVSVVVTWEVAAQCAQSRDTAAMTTAAVRMARETGHVYLYDRAVRRVRREARAS